MLQTKNKFECRRPPYMRTTLRACLKFHHGRVKFFVPFRKLFYSNLAANCLLLVNESRIRLLTMLNFRSNLNKITMR